MNRQWHKLNQVGLVGHGIGSRSWQRFALFQEKLRKIFNGAGDHYPGVGQIESLTDSSGEIERLRDNHSARGLGQKESDMVTQYAILPRDAARSPMTE